MNAEIELRMLLQESRHLFNRKKVNWKRLKVISQKMSELIKLIDDDTMAENIENSRKYFVKNLTV